MDYTYESKKYWVAYNLSSGIVHYNILPKNSVLSTANKTVEIFDTLQELTDRMDELNFDYDLDMLNDVDQIVD